MVWRQNWRQKRRKNCEIKRVQSERRNRLQKWFLSFKCVTHHVNVGFFLYINSLNWFIWFLIPSILLAASIQLRLLCSSNKFITIQIFYLNFLIFEKSSTKKIFRNVKLSYLESVLRRNVRTDRARGCIFRASTSTNFEFFFFALHLSFSRQSDTPSQEQYNYVMDLILMLSVYISKWLKGICQ